MATSKKTTTKAKTTTAKPKPVASLVTDETDMELDAMPLKGDVLDKPIDPNLIKKKDLYDHVTVTTGLRKRDVREAVDCLLEYLNTCLADGKDVQAPPLGKIRSIERGTGDKMKLHYKVNLKSANEVEKKAL